MAHVVHTRRTHAGITRASKSPVTSGSADVARANWKRQATKAGLTYEELKGGRIVRTIDGDALVTLSWEEV